MTTLPHDKIKLNTSQTVTTLAHYYRAEVQRSLACRRRLDQTTNWAVGATAAILGFGFSHPEITHAFFIFGLAIIYILLFVESRRYRFYDAYEYRVKLLHQNFIYSVLTEGCLELESETFWRAELASDLRYPQYKMDFKYAIARRLHANYTYLFSVLICGWLMKIALHPIPVRNLQEFLDQGAILGLPGIATLGIILVFIIHLVLLLRRSKDPGGGRDIVHSVK